MKGDNLLSFVGGAVLGAAIAILFAPDSGEATRKKIKETFDKEYENLKEKFKKCESEEAQTDPKTE